MKPTLSHLLPLPRSIKPFDEAWTPPSALEIHFDLAGELDGTQLPATRRLERALARHGARARSLARPAGRHGHVLVRLEPDAGQAAEGYCLDVTAAGARVVAGDVAGLRHGLATLTQLVAHAARGAVPCARIEDEPAFAERGVMLDVSRDRVPTNETLHALVEELAAWKINRLQLYTEHTFAYAGFEDVWRGADPITPAELRRLDTLCAANGIELVPNQQSFGHMHRWLVHARLRPLAERPDGVEHPFSKEKEPFSLCPIDPASLELVEGLWEQLLACVTSRSLNVGCDETFDLGTGRSRAACAERGVGRVYLEYLAALAARLAARGVRMQFWADILLHHAELAGELPDNVVPMLWGYEANHPFDEQARVLAASGRPFHVCPGTSSWQSFAGRLTNMVANIEAATRAGRAHGAAGVLVTDWGDRGHLQPQVASYPGWVTSADLAWNADSPAARRTPAGLAELLDLHVFADEARAAGRAAVQLAQVAEETGAHIPNASPLSVIVTRCDEALPPPELAGLTAAGLERAEACVEDALATLDAQRMTCATRTTLDAELRHAAGLMRCAARLGRARLAAGGEVPLEELPADVRAPLLADVDACLAEHRRLWPLRSRPGGLAASARWLEAPRERLYVGCPPGE